MTHKYKIQSTVSFWLSIALNVVPVLVFIIMGISVADTNEKIILSFTGLAAAILGVIMLLSKAKLGRSIFWIIFLVMYFCLDKLYPLIITMGICTIIDELLVSPFHTRVHTHYVNNKDIDKRIEELNK